MVKLLHIHIMTNYVANNMFFQESIMMRKCSSHNCIMRIFILIFLTNFVKKLKPINDHASKILGKPSLSTASIALKVIIETDSLHTPTYTHTHTHSDSPRVFSHYFFPFYCKRAKREYLESRMIHINIPLMVSYFSSSILSSTTDSRPLESTF